jgi:hypothetical protein
VAAAAVAAAAAAAAIQFNSIHFYLCANLTARRPITKYARETTKILQ